MAGITPSTIVKGVGPDIAEATFVNELRVHNSPAVAEAARVYRYCVERGFSPAALLGMFREESTYATNPAAICVAPPLPTKSWGNTTVPSYGDPGLGLPFVRGRFTRYAGWYEGGISTVARLFEHPPYDGKATIAEIIRVWAPPDDNNRTEDYIAGVVATMNRLGATPQPGTGGTTVAQIADRAYLDWSGGNRPRTPLKGFHAVVTHETANEKAGANAEMHRVYATGPSEGGGASYHLVADKVESIQLLTLAEVGYHIGDGANDADDEAFFTVGGEICVNDRAGYPAACRNMARAFARVLKEKNRPVIDGVTLRQHGSYWSPRNPQVHQGCPQHLKARDWGVSWAQFVGMVTEELEALNLGPAPVGEAANQRLLLDTVAREYPGDEAARYLGSLVREGKLLARAAGFGQSDVERVAIYQKGALHTLGGYVYAFFDEAAAAVDPALAPATVAGLMANGHIVLYS